MRFAMVLAPLCVILGLSGCSGVNPPDTAQMVYAVGASYEALAKLAMNYTSSPTADPASVTIIRKASDAANSALDSATTLISACPRVAGKYDTSCVNSTLVLTSLSAAESAVAALDQALVKYNAKPTVVAK